MSNENERYKILAQVHSLCKDDPAFLREVINVGVAGVAERAQREMERAADMEVLASVLLTQIENDKITPKTKEWLNNLAQSKLEKWIPELRCTWDIRPEGTATRKEE